MKKAKNRGRALGILCAVLAAASLAGFFWSGFHVRFLVTFILCSLSAILNFNRAR
ncbi:MAG: hypothetical protein IKL99_07045 [Oscillospiraceae bacterium]|nr:hypothetical protein [Oscillospiraceae bacterium]MBR6739415.1 hypothetical protein [Oscillospiraceae bacterium]